MQLTVFPASRPVALSMILASALLTGISIMPVQAEPQEATGRSRAPVSLQSDQANLPAGITRTRSIAPASHEGSAAGIDTSSRSRASNTAK